MTWRYLDARDGAVEYLTLNRPDVRNAINDEVGADVNWMQRALFCRR